MSRIKLSGSCLCGSVAYEITGNLRGFFHCHCSRCRKATGTGHASNIILKPEDARWPRGESLLAGFHVPGAARFRTVYCSRCGSPLPRVAADMSYAVVPAGSLDQPPEIRPTARIFWDSRAEWSCGGEEIQVWPEYPQTG